MRDCFLRRLLALLFFSYAWLSMMAFGYIVAWRILWGCYPPWS